MLGSVQYTLSAGMAMGPFTSKQVCGQHHVAFSHMFHYHPATHQFAITAALLGLLEYGLDIISPDSKGWANSPKVIVDVDSSLISRLLGGIKFLLSKYVNISSLRKLLCLKFHLQSIRPI